MANSYSDSLTDPKIMDQSVKPTEDFYRHANGTWLKEHEIPSDRPSDGAFYKLRDEAEEHIHTIVEALDPASADVEEQKLATLYGQFMDEEAVEALGAKPLAPDFALIDQAETHTELAVAMGKLATTGIGGILEAIIDADMNDPARYTVFTYQAGISLPDEAYYREDQYETVRQGLVTYLNKAREIIATDAQFEGWAGAVGEAFGADVLAFETKVASHHWDNVKTRDAVASNNPTTFSKFAESSDNYPWAAWWEATGLPTAGDTPVNVRQPSYVEAIPSLWNDTDLETLKKWAYAKVIQARSAYLAKAFVDNGFEFNRLLTGATEQRPRWKRGVSFVEGAMGEALGKKYVAKHFPPEYKQQMNKLVEHLLEAYRRSISQLEWMGKETRERALDKLAGFTPKVGYPDEWKDYSKLTPGATLVESVRAVAQFHVDEEAGKLSGPVNKKEWFMTPQTVNAYYHPTMNEIVFPAAILQNPFFDPSETDAVNFAAIGAVIGHEIGHGFDDQGSHYDGEGKLNNWWTEQDRKAFEERTSNLIAQYDAFSPEQLDDSHKVNGKLTIGENIGDLGGLGIAWKAYHIALEESGRTEADEERGGLTAAQQFFYSWARIWRSKSRDEWALQLLAIDPHSPSEFRCNGVLRNVDAFHETFHTQPGDGMWLDPSERVEIW